jgi:lipoate-protein ligase A
MLRTTLLYKNIFTRPLVFRATQPCYPSITNAFELWLMSQTPYPTCFIRTTDECVVIGSNQLAQAECNLKKMKEDNVKLIRRKSGGGAVFLDQGNCLFGMVGNDKEVTTQKFLDVLTKSIDNTFEVKSVPTGKNDVSINGNKIAGLAYRLDKDRFLCHACILVSANVSKLPLYLTPNQKKIESHHIKSVDKRVVNLCDFAKNKSRGDLENQLIKVFAETYISNMDCGDYIVNVDEKYMLSIPEVKKIYEEQSTDEYLYGKKNLKYNQQVSHKFPWGFIELYLQVNSGVVIDVTINTDCLDTDIPRELEALLKNMCIENISEMIREYSAKENKKQQVVDAMKLLEVC